LHNRLEHVVDLEIGFAAGNVDIPAGRKATVFEVHDADPPGAFCDGLLAVTTSGLTATGMFGASDASKAWVLLTLERSNPQVLRVRYWLSRLLQCLKHGIRKLVCRADWMEPEGHLAGSEGVRQAFAKAHLSLRDGLTTAATLGAAAGCGY